MFKVFLAYLEVKQIYTLIYNSLQQSFLQQFCAAGVKRQTDPPKLVPSAFNNVFDSFMAIGGGTGLTHTQRKHQTPAWNIMFLGWLKVNLLPTDTSSLTIKWWISPKYFLIRCLLQAIVNFYFIVLLHELLSSLPKPSIRLCANPLIYMCILICLYENFTDLLTGIPINNLSSKYILLLSHTMQLINILSLFRLNTSIQGKQLL